MGGKLGGRENRGKHLVQFFIVFCTIAPGGQCLNYNINGIYFLSFAPEGRGLPLGTIKERKESNIKKRKKEKIKH